MRSLPTREEAMSKPDPVEEEAEKVWKEITLAGYIGGAWSWPDASKAVPIITAAIKKYGNQKLTEASKIALEKSTKPWGVKGCPDDWTGGYETAVNEIAESIQELKAGGNEGSLRSDFR